MNQIGLILTIVSAVVVLSGCAPALAIEKNCALPSEDRMELNHHCSLLIDPTNTLTFKEAASPDRAKLFVPLRKGQAGFGFTQATYWVKFEIPASSRQRYLELGYPLMDHADFYILMPDGSWRIKKTGAMLPFQEREVRHRTFIAVIDPIEKTDTQVYLRLKTEDRMEFPLVLWSPVSFYNNIRIEQFILGIYYGFLIIMICYNLLLYISIKDRSYLYYVLYIAMLAVLMLQQNGYLREFAPFIPHHCVPYLNSVLLILIGLFVMSYLNTREQLPRLHRIFIGILCLTILPPIASFFNYNRAIQLNIMIMLISIIIVFIAGILSLRLGYRPARYFLLAWTAFLTGAFILNLKVMAILPNNPYTSYAVQVGSALEVTLLSLGLGDRINTIQEEALKTQTRMTQSFARFVPHEFLEMLARESIVDVQLGDQVLHEMTVLFSDIRSFTSMSERLTPKETIDFLNDFFGRIGPVIRSHGGFVDKYIGDAVMALFPNKPANAINAALAMARELDVFNHERRSGGHETINIGIGIHTGTLVLGTIGEIDRLETTVIADAVNTASRIEGLNKELGTLILASNDTVERLGDTGHYTIRDCGPMKIRGKTEPIRCFEISESSITAAHQFTP